MGYVILHTVLSLILKEEVDRYGWWGAPYPRSPKSILCIEKKDFLVLYTKGIVSQDEYLNWKTNFKKESFLHAF
jgi:hypothetical protein